MKPSFANCSAVLVLQLSHAGKFLTPDSGDFSAASPLYTKLAAAAKAQNEAQVSALLGQLDAVNDHSEQIAAYLTSHCLTACAQLESR